ncbi:MAG: glycosyl transferase family 1 [Nitrospirae bacterium RBG_13_43_8]|nr:MAG: glycosyl transferase family 1 [Nitrospirae bacterium RBG_13_43_8]
MEVQARTIPPFKLKLDDYIGIAPKIDLVLIQKLADRFAGKQFLHINSTKSGGGVAEILQRMITVLTELGINARWEVIEGDSKFFDITKKIHNALQGNPEQISEDMWQYHFEVTKRNTENLNLDADAVLIHDPQPAPLIEFKKTGTWIWRCHIDVSNPIAGVWSSLKRYIEKYNATIFSVAKFARKLPLDKFIIPPAIAPLNDKNRELTGSEINKVLEKLNLPDDKPIVLQVSRFDRFKDPIGVIKAYKLVKRYNDCRLVLAGSPATDDPESDVVLNEVKKYAGNDTDIYILQLPPFSDIEINALQRAATVVIQKSLKEGFGLTVSEAMWKGKPVIGGAVGGIPLQIIHGVTGFLVNSVEGAAFRMRQLLNNPEIAKKIGETSREYVRKNFLITRQIRDYLSVWYIMENKGKSVIEL